MTASVIAASLDANRIIIAILNSRPKLRLLRSNLDGFPIELFA